VFIIQLEIAVNYEFFAESSVETKIRSAMGTNNLEKWLEFFCGKAF